MPKHAPPWRRARWPLACAATVALTALSSPAHAWGIGSALGPTGCHEPITAEAFRAVRKLFATAPPIVPTRDERALIADVQFSPPDDMKPDLAGMTLLLGVRDNDLKGQNPADSLDLVQVHGNPDNQDEHCIRAATDDGAVGNMAALTACRTFILGRVAEALDGLDSAGKVDPAKRFALPVFVNLAGHVSPPLPLFYVRMGQGLHALEDGFTHTYRTADGMNVTTVLNWIDVVTQKYDEARDGPQHLSALDNCESKDPIVVRNRRLATQAATEVLAAALDPGKSHDEKLGAVDTITARYLTYQAGCSFDNAWCNAPEASVISSTACGCRAGGRESAAPKAALLLLSALLLVRVRRKHGAVMMALAVLLAAPAVRADQAAPPPAPTGPAGPETPVPSSAAPDTPVPLPPPKAKDVQSTIKGDEPGRDTKTPTMKEIQSIREDKRLGSRLGFYFSLGASYARPAVEFSVGGRYRLNERWVTGLDVEWNPWITTAPRAVKAGALNIYGTLIRRFPMSFDRVNLRTSLHLGTSTMLFDVYGAPSRSTGPFVGVSLLGLDFDLGGAWRLVFDPADIAVPVPVLGKLPLFYEQYRFVIGLQYGS